MAGRGPPLDRTNGVGQSVVACPEDSRRTQVLRGFSISERTVSRILRTLRRPPTQTWRTFLHNHLGQTVFMDFFTVPTVHHERVVRVHRAGTSSASGAALQCDGSSDRRPGLLSRLWRLSPIERPARYVIRDRDSIYDNEVHWRIASLGMEEVLTAPSESLAEPLRRAPNRLHPERVPEPFCDPERQPSEEEPNFVSPLLPRVQNRLGTRQAMSIFTICLKRWENCQHSASWRSPSPL